MKKLTLQQRQWMITFHLLFLIALLGHVIDMVVLLLNMANANSAEYLQENLVNLRLLGSVVGPISAAGTALTGIFLSVCTNWGLFKHRWIIVKILLTPIVIVIGALGINKWTAQALDLISRNGLAAYSDFVTLSHKLLTGLVIQIGFLVFMTLISVMKPWRKKRIAN